MTNGPIRILHVVFSLEAGGLENGVVNVARALNPETFCLRVCCLETTGKLAGRLPPGITVTALGKPPGFSPVTILRLAKIIRAFKPAIVHTHNLGPLIYACAARWLAPRFALLHGEHGMIKPAEMGRFHLWLRRRLHSRCHRVHTVSNALRDYFIGLGFRADLMEAVVNGVDDSHFRPANKNEVRRQLALPEAAQVVGMVGSLYRLKRHREVLAAFDLIAKDFPQCHLLIVGAGPEQQALQEQAGRSPAAERVHFYGYQADPRLFYQAMDLLMVASIREGLSNVALEAMACGVPVLASPACGNAEIISPGQDGFLASMADAQQIAAELRHALGDASRLSFFGRQARDKVRRQFSFQRMVEAYASLYRRLHEF